MQTFNDTVWEDVFELGVVTWWEGLYPLEVPQQPSDFQGAHVTTPVRGACSPKPFAMVPG